MEELIPQVILNCNISDARYWGFHSTCGLLLRLREQYRFESGMKPWEKAETGDIARWIGQREALWKEVEGMDFSPIRIGGGQYGPFEAAEINGAIRRQCGDGLLYGAGYGVFGKPVFFVADLEDSHELEGYEVYVSGREYARDLSLHPAMLQGRTVLARKEIIKLLIWEKYEESLGKREGALREAFSSYGLEPPAQAGRRPDDRAAYEKVEEIASSELPFYIYHEVGEAVEGERLGPGWTAMLASILPSRASAYARAVKDVMADNSEKGALRRIADQRNRGALAFHVVFLSGLRRVMSREVLEAYEGFAKAGWEGIEKARAACYLRAKAVAAELLGIYEAGEGPETMEAAVQEKLKQCG
jgi:hypothetical protein